MKSESETGGEEQSAKMIGGQIDGDGMVQSATVLINGDGKRLIAYSQNEKTTQIY